MNIAAQEENEKRKKAAKRIKSAENKGWTSIQLINKKWMGFSPDNSGEEGREEIPKLKKSKN